jgi:hypothetical protein
MTDSFGSQFRLSAAVAGRAGLVMIATVLILRAVSIGIRGRGVLNWKASLTLALIFGAVSFCILFVSTLNKLRHAAPVNAILTDAQPNAAKSGIPISGFVAMQYYALILNRTFVVFTLPEGIYGWKVAGIVAAGPGASRYFEPYKQMLEDPSQMPSLEAIRKLSNLPGGFFISRSSIAGVEFNPKPKWGMGGILIREGLKSSTSLEGPRNSFSLAR